MADEPKAPEPAAQPPAAAAPAAAAGGPPTKLILAGCGGLAAIGLLIVLIWGLVSLFGGGLSVPGTGPDLGSPEKAAESYVTFDEKKKLVAMEDDASRTGKKCDQQRELLPWMADKSEAEKEIKRMEAKSEAYRKHRSDLREFKVTVVENKDGVVKVKVTGKRLDRDGEGWKLVDRTDEKYVSLTKIEGKWKVKS